MSGPCKPAFFGLSGRPPFSPANSPTTHARLPEDFYHCYSRSFVDNLRPTASPLALFERRLAEERTPTSAAWFGTSAAPWPNLS
jgi:hypothetical protein